MTQALEVGDFDVAAVRRRFSSLDRGFAFFDAPGGSQVPDEVGAAMAACLRDASGNLGAPYATGDRVGEILMSAEARSAAFLGCDPDEIVFGPNMTSLNFTLTRTATRAWKPGDRILSSSLDHDGNVAPWLEAARDFGLEVDRIELDADARLDLDDLERKLTDRTRVVAFSWASNAAGTVVDAARACQLAREAGALSWIDAVHYAAHEPIDVRAIGADVVLCSPYKWCGPHLGIAAVRRDVLSDWRPYKARPVPTTPLGRSFHPGTLPFELLAGLNATYDYLEAIGGLDALRPYERALGQRFVDGLPGNVTLHGLPGMEGRVPTFLVTIRDVPAETVATSLAADGFGVWAHDTWYSLDLYSRLGYESTAVRIGMAHYNSADEVDGLLERLARFDERHPR